MNSMHACTREADNCGFSTARTSCVHREPASREKAKERQNECGLISTFPPRETVTMLRFRRLATLFCDRSQEWFSITFYNRSILDTTWDPSCRILPRSRAWDDFTKRFNVMLQSVRNLLSNLSFMLSRSIRNEFAFTIRSPPTSSGWHASRRSGSCSCVRCRQCWPRCRCCKGYRP